MPEPDAASSIPPIHLEETIRAIAGLRAEHRANATRHQRFVDRITSLIGRANFIAALSVFVVGWVSLNGLAAALGYPALDPPPFAWLTGATSLASLYLVILILTTQTGDDRLTQRLELLNLELTILSEQKIAKVVALLEELRQDSPQLHDRIDELADAMSRPADPQSVIDAIKETRSESAHVSRAEGV
ncbi:putative membrane protein [Roseiarcus fermentans]|uniref:Putative membrane protein n=1 Tax=Roseiarcus fermentans TaxID=1473586 RepID=A0A366FRV6_9HYPH|nr:DUF1003 domain-containing protein [Roseiarcus fermentans]RBP17261.1 putative membrane protein [Roseiarcus fermentans]